MRHRGETVDHAVELHEVKSGQFIDNPDTQRKFEAAQSWCKIRGMKFRVVTK